MNAQILPDSDEQSAQSVQLRLENRRPAPAHTPAMLRAKAEAALGAAQAAAAAQQATAELPSRRPCTDDFFSPLPLMNAISMGAQHGLASLGPRGGAKVFVVPATDHARLLHAPAV